ncbi:MAG: hypothetical protein OXG72_00085 [Acidobacteria bacterium]|nr:hypothetical protein [Acidobacteriota bacterium]
MKRTKSRAIACVLLGVALIVGVLAAVGAFADAAAAQTKDPSWWCSRENLRSHTEVGGNSFIRCRIVNRAPEPILVQMYTSGGTAFSGNAGPEYIRSRISDHVNCTVYDRPVTRAGDYALTICDEVWVPAGNVRLMSIPVYHHRVHDGLTLDVVAQVSAPYQRKLVFPATLRPVNQAQVDAQRAAYQDRQWRNRALRQVNAAICDSYQVLLDTRSALRETPRRTDKWTAERDARSRINDALASANAMASVFCKHPVPGSPFA